MARAQAFVTMTAEAPGEDFAARRAEAVLASRIAAALARTEGALGVLNPDANALVSAGSFAAEVAAMGGSRWRVEAWVGLRLVSNPAETAAGTKNARFFLGHELAVRVRPGETPVDALTTLATCMSYLLGQGPVLADGETIALGPGTVLRVAVDRGTPDIYFLDREAA